MKIGKIILFAFGSASASKLKSRNQTVESNDQFLSGKDYDDFEAANKINQAHDYDPMWCTGSVKHRSA